MVSRPCPDMHYSSRLRQTVKRLAFVFAFLLVSCGGQGQPADIRVNETKALSPIVSGETVPLNNCGGKENTEVLAQRSLNISIEGNIGVEVKVLEANLRAKYERGQASSLKLVAAPGTNMEFEVEWMEQPFFGELTVEGQSGKATYTVRVPTPKLKASRDLGCISGEYRLVRWDEARSPVTLYINAQGGTLKIDKNGEATWTVVLQEPGRNVSPQPKISCKGRFYNSSKQLEGVPGAGNVSFDWTSNMESRSEDIWLTFCGWANPGRSDPFKLFPKELSGGKRSLEMQNSKGTLIWEQ